ncbi:dnaJ homolog subfamily C member 30, mitochondrial-like [Amblyomma americanum]|uniref:J domain-containing protein n=1 Tax=Amblyomma americanum TaxID=6943 RepID=A0AAQ4DZ86_AMBAM
MRARMVEFPRATCGIVLSRRLASNGRRTFYDILEVSPNAKQNEIKAAYYRLSMRHHPDKNKGSSAANERFQEITAAYDTLSNESLRATYDERIGTAPQKSTTFHAIKPTQRPTPMSGRTPIYNFDEFYRQHYGAAVHSYQVRKKKYEEYMQQQELMRERGSGIAVTLIMAIILTVAALYQWDVGHDVPRSPGTEKREK